MSSQKLRVGVFEKLYVSCSSIDLEVLNKKKLAHCFKSTEILVKSKETA